MGGNGSPEGPGRVVVDVLKSTTGDTPLAKPEHIPIVEVVHLTGLRVHLPGLVEHLPRLVMHFPRLGRKFGQNR